VLGTAMAMVNATDAVDVVLNSLAIGFIFEIDDAFYKLHSKSARHRYQRMRRCDEGTYVGVRGTDTIAQGYTFVFCLVNIVLGIYRYQDLVLSRDTAFVEAEHTTLIVLPILIWTRVIVSAVATMHMDLRFSWRTVGGSEQRTALAWQVCRALLCAGIIALEGLGVETFVYLLTGTKESPPALGINPESLEIGLACYETCDCNNMPVGEMYLEVGTDLCRQHNYTQWEECNRTVMYQMFRENSGLEILKAKWKAVESEGYLGIN